MDDYLDSKADDFDGIDLKRFLLGQAHEQVLWYRQTIDALDFVGSVACRRSPSAVQNTSETPISPSCPRCGRDRIPTKTRGFQMLVRLRTTDYLIYAELDKTERVTHLASKNQIRGDTCYAILHEIKARDDYQIT